MNFSRHIFVFARALKGKVSLLLSAQTVVKKEQQQNGVENLSRRMLPKSVIKFNNEGDIDAQM
ncbi:hypothetical protein ACOMICROBIO_NCLOACGD_01231 [Vibrio sp. B1ASS3]|nr:hypothetical protein E1100_11985 [Vibrio owensii]CAD7804101.1 hypothetical protein ACOMICROBIO_NCLOACGD_01231 [Vibrio sp. B1ASS3]CAE6896487.1 hypothetical protein ACOMICROBIO_NCLOACGD_01231 [Vibrio sp. B1ASS3]